MLRHVGYIGNPLVNMRYCLQAKMADLMLSISTIRAEAKLRGNGIGCMGSVHMRLLQSAIVCCSKCSFDAINPISMIVECDWSQRHYQGQLVIAGQNAPQSCFAPCRVLASVLQD